MPAHEMTKEATSVHPPSSPIEDGNMCGLTELVSSCLSPSKPSPSSSSSTCFIPCKENATRSDGAAPFLSISLFPNVPPTVQFYTKGTKVSKPSRKVCSKLTWCYNSLLPIVMRQSLATSHFRVVDESVVWLGYWGRHLKSSDYRRILPYQKVNHFPGAFHIGRKDRLWMHVSSMIDEWGEEYRILPITYLLPKEMDNLLAYLDADPTAHVILKPPASARGTGISVTRKIKDCNGKTPLVAQHYIHRPMTLNGAKFDLRLYAYVPCVDPLRIYLYEEGLVRFASVEYSSNVSTYSNRYMHLTNYSINKLAESDGVSSSPVPKWRLTELWRYLDERGVDSQKILRDIEMVIIKAFIACEKPIREHIVKHTYSGYVCHELFGVDILLDEDARPWLLEVNISPSLHSGTPLDSAVKAPLAKDVLNMAGICIPSACTTSLNSPQYASRPRRWPKGTRQVMKEHQMEEEFACSGRLSPRLLHKFSPEDVRMLVEFEDEYRRRGDFRLLFPTPDTVPLLKYFREPVYGTLLLSKWQVSQAMDRQPGIDRLVDLCHTGIVLSEEQEEDFSDEGGDDEEDEDEDEEEGNDSAEGES